MSTAADYRNGGEGFRLWVEENICVPVYPPGSLVPVWTPVADMSRELHPETGKSFYGMWEAQAEVAKEALRMKDGRFIYRLLVFCWMRGEGKSLFVCLIQLWKFFNWPRQMIVLGANSKDQVQFVHYAIMRDIILNSPKLLAKIGLKNIQEKEIRVRDASGNIGSTVKSISSFSGIVSNITGYTFSEIFDMKNPKFFYQLDGSTRNIPNALGTIDSTVSDRTHPLYKLYTIWKENRDPTLFFSFRCSEDAKAADFWNPMMTDVQIQSYKTKFPKAEFDQYFRNTWDSGSAKIFTPGMVEAIHYIGYNTSLGMNEEVVQTLETVDKLKKKLENGDESYNEIEGESATARVHVLTQSLIPVSSAYKLTTPNGHPRMATMVELQKLGEMYKTDWLIAAGVDRSDPMKAGSTNARTSVAIIAKGLPGSKNNLSMLLDEGTKKYIYFLLHLALVNSASMDDIKTELMGAHDEFGGIDILGAERWGMWDISGWCSEKEILFEPVHPTYDKQKDAFAELFTIFKQGLFKAPAIALAGSKGEDILVEEAKMFDHNPHKKWFGSPEKNMKYGVQDDVMYSVGWGIHSARMFGVEHFRERNNVYRFGEFYKEKTAGAY